MNPISKKITYFIPVAAILLLFCSRCANTQQGPSGGAKDTIPPVLLKTLPKENAVHFNGTKVVLTFDEFMALKDASKNVVMSPPSLQRPTVQRRGKEIQVLFRDSLRSNKTYTINFGNALTDNNEGNAVAPYKFVFSTGAVIDTMAFIGMVRDAYTLEPLGGVNVQLYENLADSAVYKEMPVAVGRTDAWGYFSIQNIAPQTYYMYAVEDKNSNYRYDAGSEKMAFLDTVVVPDITVSLLPPAPDSKDTAALLARPYERTLLASTENVRKQFLSAHSQLGKRQFQLLFNQRNPVIICFEMDGLDSTGYVIESSRFRDTLTYWITAETPPDTLRAVVEYFKTDSLDKLSPTETRLRFTFKEPEKKEKNKDKDKPEETPKLQPKIDFSAELGMHRGMAVAFDALPVKIDTTKLSLFKIDAEKKTRTKENFRWVQNSLRRFYVQAKWTSVTAYELEALPEAFTDVYGLTNDTIIKKITTPNPDKYCHVTFQLSNVSAQYIVQILNGKKDRIMREATVDKDGKLLFDYLPAGEYCVRFFRDDNGNGVWDAAEPAKKKQAEKVAFVKFSEKSDILLLRENSEIDQTVDVKALFAPEQISLHLHHHHHNHEEDGEDLDHHHHHETDEDHDHE